MTEIDWRFKGFPPELDGINVRDIASRDLTVTDFMPPIATIDNAALAANVQAMADYCSAHRVRLAPHAKTAMSPGLADRQLAAGAVGLTVATVSQARVFHAHGVRRLRPGRSRAGDRLASGVAQRVHRPARLRPLRAPYAAT
jgi:D-serine deaminase-like pyridoxal phosphate-dependent protein